MSSLLVVVGPTAGGKTAYSLALAKQRGNAEIINADSRQLYRHLNIGTAKILPEEMQGIPHHLLDVLEPDEPVTVGWYQQRALEVINDIQQRGNTPILVGGSMLYVSAVVDNLALAPAADDDRRARLSEEYDRDVGQTLYARLQELDPQSARSVHPNNKPHLVRAVEICEVLQAPKSATGPRTQRTGTADTPYQLEMYGMQWNRDALVERIHRRTAAMFRAGWVEEVRDLLQCGYGPDDPAMQSHGYREIVWYITAGEPSSLEELQETISVKARQYAKRQMTWWRRDPRIQWVNPLHDVETESEAG